MDYTSILTEIRDEQREIIETQELLLETMTFVLNSSNDNQETIDRLNQRLDELFLMSPDADAVAARVETLEKEVGRLATELQTGRQMYKTALTEQKEFFKRLTEETAALKTDLSQQNERLQTSLDAISGRDAKLEQQFESVAQSSDVIQKYLASLESLMRLIADNQLLDNPKSDGEAVSATEIDGDDGD